MTTLPKYITRFFWGDNLKELSFSEHKSYIIKNLLERGDQKAINWLFKSTSKKDIKKSINSRMSKKTSNFWNLYLG